MIIQKFQKGINIGGWLSQYEFAAKEPLTGENLSGHFDTFISEGDIRRIGEWGFDHIRLPVSGYLLYDREKKQIKPEIMAYIDRCVLWCAAYGLNMVLDLHDLWGNVYGAMDTVMPLLEDEKLKDNFYRIWEEFAQHFRGKETGITVMFELLNEVSDASGYLWNRMYKEAVKRIRSIDKERPILAGSNAQNSVSCLSQLDLLEDENVCYNFHFYEPLVFTHQKAHFSEELKEFNQTVTYPGDISGFRDYLKKHPQYQMKYALTAEETVNDRALMERLLEHARKFAAYSGCQLYCGEFGVIDSAPPEEAAKWVRDLTGMFADYRIGHALWNYKGLDFGLLDLDGNVVSRIHKQLSPFISIW